MARLGLPRGLQEVRSESVSEGRTHTSKVKFPVVEGEVGGQFRCYNPSFAFPIERGNQPDRETDTLDGHARLA